MDLQGITTFNQEHMNQEWSEQTPQPSPKQAVDDLSEVLRKVREIAETAYRIDLRQYESESNDVSPATVCQTVLALRTPTLVALNDILMHFDEAEGDPAGKTELGFPNQVDPVASNAANERRQLADLAFLAITEISYRFDALESAFGQGGQWEIVSGCGNCLGAVLKALSAVEKTLCGHLKIVAQLQFLDETRISVEIRTAYARFLYSLDSGTPPTSHTIDAYLHRADTCIAALINCEAYPRMRASDRMQIRYVHGQILKYRSGKNEASPIHGIHLWKDLVAFAELLLEINQRADLIEYDRTIVRLVNEELFSAAEPPRRISDELRLRLKTLFGRDLELDGLLENPSVVNPESFKEPVQRLHRLLMSPPDGPSEQQRRSTLEFKLIEMTTPIQNQTF